MTAGNTLKKSETEIETVVEIAAPACARIRGQGGEG